VAERISRLMTANAGNLLLTAAGGILIWAGLKGKSVTGVVRALIGGESPASAPNANSVTGASGTTSGTTGIPTGIGNTTSGSASANQSLARQIASAMGLSSWTTGQEWSDWVSLWNQESGWSATATNPGSGAYGIAQALGHGTGTATEGASGGNEYGGYGVSTSVAQQANSGDAAAQITWGIAYILATYGSPSAAWAHEQANNWY
jgi:resuscitation-promoting factor RpfB